jgi:uncharacterized membrane protein
VTSSTRRTLVVALVALAVPALAGSIALVVVSRPVSTNAPVTQPATAAESTATASPAGSTPTPAAPGTATVSGTGDRTINEWPLPRAWQLVYSYTCTTSSGSFHLDLQSMGGGVHVTNDEHNAHGTGNDSGSTAEPTTYTLTIKTPCQWMVTVTPAA